MCVRAAEGALQHRRVAHLVVPCQGAGYGDLEFSLCRQAAACFCCSSWSSCSSSNV
jgi:hypothetical protein